MVTTYSQAKVQVQGQLVPKTVETNEWTDRQMDEWTDRQMEAIALPPVLMQLVIMQVIS